VYAAIHRFQLHIDRVVRQWNERKPLESERDAGAVGGA
jgi:hypothetical protein